MWLKKFFAFSQYILPQHLLSKLCGCLAESRSPWLKNFLITQFVKYYNVNLSEAVIENPHAYLSFNDFFIRKLKPTLRPFAPLTEDVAAPVDGTVMQLGPINKGQLLQAKNFYFDLNTLLGGDKDLTNLFQEGTFATFYLAPRNYHRVHMPITGTLRRTIYVPGKLFSVNQITSEIIPKIFSRNERFISLFHTEVGPMAVILVGALIVGSIQTVWQKHPVRARNLYVQDFKKDLQLEKGAELGHFKLGSTVILLFQKEKIEWLTHANAIVQMGGRVGKSA